MKEIQEGDRVNYLSLRSVKGYPYLAPAGLVAYRRKNGTLVWKPVGPASTPQRSRGVPYGWVRAGTKKAGELENAYATAPRPWSRCNPSEDA